MGLASKLAAATAAAPPNQPVAAAGPGGAPAPAAAPPPYVPVSAARLLESLRKCVVEQKIKPFYPDDSTLQRIAQHVVDSNALEKISGRLNLPLEVIEDLVKVALFDVVLLCDNSKSMTHFDDGQRVVELKQFLEAVVTVASVLDDDGIQIRWFNSDRKADDITSPEEASALIDEVGFKSGSAIGTNLDEKILQPLLLGPAQKKQLKKPLLVIVITDGAPYGEKGVTNQKKKRWSLNAVPMVIENAKRVLQKTPYGADAVSYQFAQVGNDKAAHDFLEELDEDPSVGDLIDQTLSYEFESVKFQREGLELTRSMWYLKVILGPIDNEYDSKGEAQPGQRRPASNQQRAPTKPPSGTQGGNAPEKKGGFFKKLVKR